jgi:hypothetical protein
VKEKIIISKKQEERGKIAERERERGNFEVKRAKNAAGARIKANNRE